MRKGGVLSAPSVAPLRPPPTAAIASLGTGSAERRLGPGVPRRDGGVGGARTPFLLAEKCRILAPKCNCRHPVSVVVVHQSTLWPGRCPVKVVPQTGQHVRDIDEQSGECGTQRSPREDAEFRREPDQSHGPGLLLCEARPPFASSAFALSRVEGYRLSSQSVTVLQQFVVVQNALRA